jgi:hypothetical protein
MLDVQFHDVRISATNPEEAWEQIGVKYLLRANIYLDAKSIGITGGFQLKKEAATGRDILNAFAAAYPDLTYTIDKETSIIWIHPRSLQYADILTNEFRMLGQQLQVPMYSGVLIPLCKQLRARPNSGFDFGLPTEYTFDYGVTLPDVKLDARGILNYCCEWNLTKAFRVVSRPDGKLLIQPFNLYYGSPLQPRSSALAFWEKEIGKPSNKIPNGKELSTAMADPDPRKRWAARNYFEAASACYPPAGVIASCDNSEKKVWTLLQIKAVLGRGQIDVRLLNQLDPMLATDVERIKDPKLALVALLELTREKQNTSHLDSIISKHNFSETEIASIKSDVFRLAHESKLVLDKLKAMKLDVPEFSPEALRELESTNIFTLISPVEK